MPEIPDGLRGFNPLPLYIGLFKDILASFKLNCAAFYLFELLGLISQLSIALVFLLLFRKLGLGESPIATQDLQAGYQAVLKSWSQAVTMNQLLAALISCLAVNAITSFIATRIINRTGRRYEDLNIARAFKIFTNLRLSDYIELSKLVPFTQRYALQLMQSDVRMTAISARQLVRGSFSIIVILVLLPIIWLIEPRFFIGMLVFLFLSIIPLVIFFASGMRHSYELLALAPVMTKRKRALLDLAIARDKGVTPDDSEFVEAYASKDGDIKQYMDAFEYRFQLVNNGALAFDGLAKAATILIVFGALTLVGLDRIDYSIFILIILAMNLVIMAYRGITAVIAAISRYFVHVQRFRTFYVGREILGKNIQKSQAGESYFESSLPKTYELSLDAKQLDLSMRNLPKGSVHALLMTGAANRFRSFQLFSILFQTPSVYGWVLDTAYFVNDLDGSETMSLSEFLGLRTGVQAEDFHQFSNHLSAVFGPEVNIPASHDADWTEILSNNRLAVVVKIIGGYVFAGKVIFVNAELLTDIDDGMRNRVWDILNEGLTFIFDRRAKPNLSTLINEYTGIVLFDGDRVTLMSKEKLFSITHTEVMSYIKPQAAPSTSKLNIKDMDASMMDDFELG
jgi:hypothetical protein